jgi:hypothetical protein
MTIKDDIKSMFWEPAIDYANAVEPITFETDEELPAQQERWNKVHKAYGKGVEDVLEFISDNYDVRLKIPCKYCKCKDPDRESGQIYCKKCHKDISNGRMKFLANPGEKFEIPAKEEDPEEVQRKRLRNDFEYHDKCARATLHPSKTLEEVNFIHMEKRIEDAYKFINEILQNTTPMNTPETRKYVVELIQKRIEYQVIVRCNEENNPPDVIDQNLLIAELMWNVPYDNKGPAIQKSTLIFGDKAAVEKYQFSWMIDNETFKFIEKGI